MLPLRLKFSTKGLEPKKGADLKPLLGVGDTLIASRTWATMRPRCIKWSNSSGVSSVVNAGAPNFWGTLLEKWDTGEADDEMYAEWGGYEEMLKAQSESRDIPNRPTLRRLAKWDDEAHPTQPEIVVLTQPKIGDGVEQEEDLEESEADEDDEEEEGEDQREEPVRVGGMKRKRD